MNRHVTRRPFRPPAARTLMLLGAIVVLIWLAYSSARLAWADHLSRSNDAAIVGRAVRLSPGDADAHLRLAAVRQAASIDPTSALEAAVRLEPLNAGAWMRLGLEAEMRGDLHSAETCLLEAARVSRQFAPRWTLANYYVRRGDPARFWKWAQESLQTGYGDLNPVFQLCWHMSQDPELILERAIPRRGDVLNLYVRYLVEDGHLDASARPALQLSALASREHVSALVGWCDRQLDAAAVPDALAAWNTLCAKRLLPYAPVDRDRAPLTDGDFTAPFGTGFAWRATTVAGVVLGKNPSPHYLWVAFSGDQPETCTALVQFIPVHAGAHYRFCFDYRTTDLPPASGLRWSVLDARTGADSATASPWLSGPIWKAGELRFQAPESGLVRLALTCRRMPGATRIHGTLGLRRLSLERLP